MKIAFFEVAVPKVDESLVAQALAGHELSFFQEALNEETVEKAKDADVVSVFINSSINQKVIDAIPNLKFIATRSTGFDHIDCEYAKSKGIKVSNVAGYGSHTVAEFAFGLMLSFARNIKFNADNYMKESSSFDYSKAMAGFDLFGKTLGVIGTGKIGKNLAKIGSALGMKVVAYDLFPDLAFAKENNLENNFEYKSLEEVVSVSDFVSLHTPYSKENHHLINAAVIAKMKKGAYLINTARGELVDTSALISGLKDGTIAGFGADVIEGEKQFKDEKVLTELGKLTEEEKGLLGLNHEMMKMPNVIITPHIAFYTSEAVTSILQTTVENIKAFLAGAPSNLVN
jgi:D-lactate dehydrogenase